MRISRSAFARHGTRGMTWTPLLKGARKGRASGQSRSAPIEHLQPDAVFHGHELHAGFRRAGPGNRLLRAPQRHQESQRERDPGHGQLLGLVALLTAASPPPVRVDCRSAAAPINPPIPIESMALLGINMSAPFSFSPSYSMFIARKWRAVGLCWYDLAACSKE
jgi:hypothetical protein